MVFESSVDNVRRGQVEDWRTEVLCRSFSGWDIEFSPGFSSMVCLLDKEQPL